MDVAAKPDATLNSFIWANETTKQINSKSSPLALKQETMTLKVEECAHRDICLDYIPN